MFPSWLSMVSLTCTSQLDQHFPFAHTLRTAYQMERLPFRSILDIYPIEIDSST